MGDNEPHTNGVNGGGDSDDEVGHHEKNDSADNHDAENYNVCQRHGKNWWMENKVKQVLEWSHPGT